MKENKKINVDDIYYATLKNKQTGQNKYMICLSKRKLKSSVLIDIINDNKYYLINNEYYLFNNESFLSGEYYLNDNVICGVTPYKTIIRDAFGKISVDYLLKKDKFISKIYNEQYGEYNYKDIGEYQKTLAIIKPDGIKNVTKIIDMIYKTGLTINKYEVRLLDEKILEEHYQHLVDKPFYPKLQQYMMSGEVVIMVLEGINAIEKLRELMGPTDSSKAPKGTIRGEFGTDVTYNAIHGSDSKNSAEIEINRFFKQKQKRI